jgi:uncharacterized protein with PIN domain
VDWNLSNNFAVLVFSTFAAICFLKLGSGLGLAAVGAAFFGFCSVFGIIYEPGGWLAAILGASPFFAYALFEKTPVGRRRRAEIERREAQERKDEIKRTQRIQKQRVTREAAEEATEEAAEQSRLGEIARQKTHQMNESLEWISLRTRTENFFVMAPTGERHRPLQHARRALEGGLFFDRADLSIEERLRIEKKAGPIRAKNASRLSDYESTQERREQRKQYSSFGHRPPRIQSAHDPVGPRFDGTAWSQESELWSSYRASDSSKLQLALESTHSKCRGCGRPVSVLNKVEAMAVVARTFELPEELYWRQAIANAMWHNKRWKIEPSDLLHSKTSPLSAAARHHAWINTVDTSDLNSPYPYWAYSQAGAEGLLANFWNEDEKFSEENWEAASRLAAAAPLIDDCLDCVTRAAKSKRSRVQFSPREREAVLMRDGFRCRNCGRSPREDGIKLHVDHIEPWSKGGTNDLENLQALCEECNLGKSDQEIV